MTGLPKPSTSVSSSRNLLLKLDTQTKHKRKYGDRRLAHSLLMVKLPPKEIYDLKKERIFRFSAKELPKSLDEAGNRICRVMVMERLHPIFGLTNLDQFKQAIRDIVLAHHFSFIREARIFHPNIILHNLMVRYSDDGAVHGVLIDFDLASVGVPTSEGHHGRRTGTRRFMAIDLLEKETPLHRERFDWESFFYVICWIGTHYSNGVEIKTNALKTWDTDDDGTLSEVKQSVLVGLIRPDLATLFTDFYKPLFLSWITPIQTMFRDADAAKGQFRVTKNANPKDFDDETLGGHVIWDKLWDILAQ
ncbi:hypothetical protein A7U60_g2342 [Sanghuangporus baumii]|uniref:Fungal-type protein kinase domain-containing protein n=1 Tax=Sanghuangporus baumii TaxID=108892 RepID=A0A9Q5NAP0_SANBA|nr:hypothetical protein A7U60_g2342 [Sanghuangporus baumii]